METPCIEALGETRRLLEGLGHVVEEVPLPYDEWEVLRASITLAAAHSAAVVSGLEQKYGRRQVRSSLEETILLLATMGKVFPAEVPAQARQTGLRIGSELAAYFSRYDVLLTPTLGRVPVPLDKAKPSAAEQQMIRLLISAAGARALRVGRVRDEPEMVDIAPTITAAESVDQIAYLVDAHRGEADEYHFTDYMLFVTFFPQLIAGPIVHRLSPLGLLAVSGIRCVDQELLRLGVLTGLPLAVREHEPGFDVVRMLPQHRGQHLGGRRSAERPLPGQQPGRHRFGKDVPDGRQREPRHRRSGARCRQYFRAWALASSGV